MIVKDEAEHLPACLAGIEPVVDELVIVDTGSSDDTVAIARRYGAEVHHFPWINDFAAARNESIRHANGRYILWLDADDRIETRELEKIRKIRRNLPMEILQSYALQVICRNRSGQGVTYYQLRIFPNVAGVQFEGTVHEEVVPSLHHLGIGIKKVEIAILHTGYSDAAALYEKAGRNLAVMKRDGSCSPRTAAGHARMAQCYFGIRDYDTCIRHLLDARTMGGKSAPFYKKSYATLADCYLQTDQGDAAVELLHQALAEYPDNWYMHYLLGAAMVLTGNIMEAVPHLETALGSPREVEDIPVLSGIEARIRYYLGRCHDRMGRHEAAADMISQAMASAPGDPDILQAHGKMMARQGRFDEALRSLEKARESVPMDEVLWLTLARLYLFVGKPRAALDLYGEILSHTPGNIDALTGRLRAGLAAGAFAELTAGLEGLMILVGMNPDSDIRTENELADRIRLLSDRLSGIGETANATILAETADRIHQKPFTGAETASIE